jgi:uncharacterized lipoprotein YmbA
MVIRTRLVVIAATAAIVPALAGCVSLKRTPEARFFALRSLVEPLEAPAPAARPGRFVGVLPVGVPGHLERPQLVVWAGPGELRIDEYLRWAEPIDEGIARTLTENLDALLPAHPVVRSPWAAAANPFCRVRVDLRVFGLQESGEVRLEGRWVLLPGRGGGRSRAGRRACGAAPGRAGRVTPPPGQVSALLADLARRSRRRSKLPGGGRRLKSVSLRRARHPSWTRIPVRRKGAAMQSDDA